MKEILTKNQLAFLKTVGKDEFFSRHFYLSGGTPLAAFYLHHRYSEDLDFFSEDEVDASILAVFFKKNQKRLGIKKIDFEQSFNRNLYFFHFTQEVLKTEFTYYPFPRIEKGPIKQGVQIDSMLDIAVNKLFTIYQRTKARDYIDLYFLCHDQLFSIADLIKKARQKFDWHIDPIQLGTQFMKATETPDLPRMLSPLSRADWQGFFLEEAKRLKNDVFQ